MTLRVPTFKPQISVVLHKAIRRAALGAGAPVADRFRDAASRIDLTPLLGDGCSVRTSKSISEPAGGFSIFVIDKPLDDAGGADSVYGLVEPMDFIEIRMARDPQSVGVELPIVMRGFVSRVRRIEGMSNDGKPARGVAIEGQDYGKIWQMLQIMYLPGYVVGQDTLTGFKLFERFGVGFKTVMGPGEFVSEAIDKIVNPYLAKLMPESTPNPKAIQLAVSVKHGTTSVTGPQNREGSIYSLLRNYNDVGIWNELFLEDREDGVHCVFRPKPYRSVAGAVIDSDAPDVPVVDVPGDGIVSLAVERSDADVANYYWVRGPTFELASDIYRRQYETTDDRETVLLGGYPNSSESLYGIRVMFVGTEMGGDDVTTFNSGLPEAEHLKRNTSQLGWLDDRRRLLVEFNKDNVVFERGSARVRGDPAIRAGGFVRLLRGKTAPEYYVSSVTHDYIPYSGFFSSLTLERGRGFIDRAQRAGSSASPFYAERVQ